MALLDPSEYFEVDFEGAAGRYMLEVHQVVWRDGGVLLIGDARLRLKKGGLGVLRPGSACDLGGVGVDGLPDDQQALVLRHRL